jgi:chromosome segregation ATPase
MVGSTREEVSMTGNGVEQNELDELRHKVTEYEAALRSAAPRLAAFKRLEELARSQGTTPEAIASQAAVEVMRREKDALVTMLAGLGHERDQLKGEVAMLLINKNEAGRAVADLQVDHDALEVEVGEIVEHLSQLRAESVRLVAERSELTLEIASLREQVRQLTEALERAQAGEPVDSGDSGESVPEPVERRSSGKRTAVDSFDTDDVTEQQESEAFDAFFHAEIDHDKSRDWILG